MWRQSMVVGFLLAGLAHAALNAPQEIDLPRDTSHPERDASRAIGKNDFGFIGIYSYAYTIPELEGVYDYWRFPKILSSQLKVIRGTSDVHRGFEDGFINERARGYATRYNRVLIDWIEKHRRDWLGPRRPLTH